MDLPSLYFRLGRSQGPSRLLLLLLLPLLVVQLTPGLSGTVQCLRGERPAKATPSRYPARERVARQRTGEAAGTAERELRLDSSGREPAASPFVQGEARCAPS